MTKKIPTPAKEFIHRQSAHCESGAASNLLFNYGINISEALAFGIASGLFFGYFPFVKVNGFPFITFRNSPGRILRNTTKRLGVTIESSKFSDPVKAMDALDAALDKGIPVCLQAGVYWLPYFPESLRFHFNAHSLIAYGREGEDYLISDPVFDEPVVCSRKDLMKARFAEGVLAPRGKMYCVSNIREGVDLAGAIKKGIRGICWMMVRAPIPLIGTDGIRFFAKSVRQWPKKHGKRRASLYLGHAVRMQEEIGTGGGGFRLMFAAFLQEAAGCLRNERMNHLSEKMTKIGDKWREFALFGARICKNRSSDGDSYDRLYEILTDCADRERSVYKDLLDMI